MPTRNELAVLMKFLDELDTLIINYRISCPTALTFMRGNTEITAQHTFSRDNSTDWEVTVHD